MAMEDMANGVAGTRAARFCSDCGTALTGGRFCPGCGQAVEAVAPTQPFPRHDAAVERGADAVAGAPGVPVFEEPANGNGYPPHTPANERLLTDIDETMRLDAVPPRVAPPVAAPPAAGPRRWAIFVAGALLLVAAATVALVVVLSGGDSKDGGTDAAAAYAARVGTAFKPVDSANRRLSNALEHLDGAKRPSAGTKAAVARARTATSTARGALGALTPPTGSQRLETQMRQALDREETYLRAVALALSRPTGPGVSELQSLAGNLTSSLEAVGAPIAGAAQNVTGADALTAWAQRVRKAAARRKTQQASAPSSGTPAPGTAAPAPLPSSAAVKDCGDSITVSSTTSCPFAHSVRDAWFDAPGTTNTVSAYSAATGRTYAMSCGPTGGTITCRGGINAVVSWPWG
jgi:serine/threonine-protein kinase